MLPYKKIQGGLREGPVLEEYPSVTLIFFLVL